MMLVFSIHTSIPVISGEKTLSLHRLVDFSVYGIAFFINVFLLFTPETTKSRLAQVLAFIVIGTMVTIVVTPMEIGGDLLFVLSAVMAYKYGFLNTMMLPKVIAIIGILILARLYLVLFTDELTLRQAIGQFTIGLSFIPIVYWLFEDELRRIAKEKRLLEERAKEDQPFIEFGRNVSGVVHDFKNDLGLFSMFGQLLEMNRDEPITDQTLNEYRGYVNRLSERIERILAVTRLSRSAGVKTFDVADLINSVLYVFQSNLEFKRNINFSVNVPAEATYVTSNPAEIVAIVENVVRNSCEALVDMYGSSEEAVSQAFVTVTCTVGDGVVTLMITDNGPGIPECFDCPHDNCLDCPVFRIGRTTKPGGTGLGLFNVRSAARRLGAEVAIASARGEGVTTTVTIPVERVDVGIPAEIYS